MLANRASEETSARRNPIMSGSLSQTTVRACVQWGCRTNGRAQSLLLPNTLALHLSPPASASRPSYRPTPYIPSPSPTPVRTRLCCRPTGIFRIAGPSASAFALPVPFATKAERQSHRHLDRQTPIQHPPRTLHTARQPPFAPDLLAL